MTLGSSCVRSEYLLRQMTEKARDTHTHTQVHRPGLWRDLMILPLTWLSTLPLFLFAIDALNIRREEREKEQLHPKLSPCCLIHPSSFSLHVKVYFYSLTNWHGELHFLLSPDKEHNLTIYVSREKNGPLDQSTICSRHIASAKGRNTFPLLRGTSSVHAHLERGAHIWPGRCSCCPCCSFHSDLCFYF